MIYRTLHRKLKIDQHEPQYKPGWDSDVPEGLSFHAPLTYFQFLVMHYSVKSRNIKAFDIGIFET